MRGFVACDEQLCFSRKAAVAPHHQAITIMLDFVAPVGTQRSRPEGCSRVRGGESHANSLLKRAKSQQPNRVRLPAISGQDDSPA
jgi:hypothetical protein